MKTEKRWTVQASVPGVYCIRSVPENHCLAVVGGVDAATQGQNRENARLMAMAPELRACLGEVTRALERSLAAAPSDNTDQLILLRALAVLARVEGGQ